MAVWMVSMNAAGPLDGGRYAGLNDAVAPVGRPDAVSWIGLESAPLTGLTANAKVAAFPAGMVTEVCPVATSAKSAANVGPTITMAGADDEESRLALPA